MKRSSYHNRRYRLHRMVKRFTRMNARKHEVYVTQEILDCLGDRDTRYVNSLRDEYGYNIQFEIK